MGSPRMLNVKCSFGNSPSLTYGSIFVLVQLLMRTYLKHLEKSLLGPKNKSSSLATFFVSIISSLSIRDLHYFWSWLTIVFVSSCSMCSYYNVMNTSSSMPKQSKSMITYLFKKAVLNVAHLTISKFVSSDSNLTLLCLSCIYIPSNNEGSTTKTPLHPPSLN